MVSILRRLSASMSSKSRLAPSVMPHSGMGMKCAIFFEPVPSLRFQKNTARSPFADSRS